MMFYRVVFEGSNTGDDWDLIGEAHTETLQFVEPPHMPIRKYIRMRIEDEHGEPVCDAFELSTPPRLRLCAWKEES